MSDIDAKRRASDRPPARRPNAAASLTRGGPPDCMGAHGSTDRADHEGLTDWFAEPWVRIVIILGAAVLVTLASRLIVSRFRKKLEGTASITQELNLQRATTLTGALSTALIVVIWVLAILMALGSSRRTSRRCSRAPASWASPSDSARRPS